MTTDDAAAGQTPAAATAIVIPDEVKAKFGDLIALILKSESMNDEERQYWVNILPVMTPDQVQNLRDILENERKQLAAIDQKYSQNMNPESQTAFIQQVDEERRKRMSERTAAEASSRAEESAAAEDLLTKMDEIA